MLPVAQLEAILGAFLAQMIAVKNPEFEYKQIGTYEDIQVIGI